MTGEPMTDVDRIRAQWVADLRARIAANKNCKFVQVSSLQLACLFKELDETAAERDRHANAYVELHGQHVTRMLELADARSALKRAEAARDAALARAMPEPRLMRTVEDVEALPNGFYWVRPSDPLGVSQAHVRIRRRWVNPRRADRSFVGWWISGPLPSLPIPPTEDSTHDRP